MFVRNLNLPFQRLDAQICVCDKKKQRYSGFTAEQKYEIWNAQSIIFWMCLLVCFSGV